MKTFRLLIASCIIILTLSSCKKDSGPSESTPATQETTTNIDVNGGTVVTNNVTISVQPGTFNSKVSFSVSKDSNIPVQVDPTVGTYDKNNVYKITTTNKDSIKTPIRITIPYDPSIIPAGYSEADLIAVHISQSSYEFVQVSVDAQNKKITFETTSFSWFSAGVPTHKTEFPTIYTELNKVITFENDVVPSSVIQSYDYSTTINNTQLHHDNFYWGVMQVPSAIDQGGNHSKVAYASRFMNNSNNPTLNSQRYVDACMVFKLDLSETQNAWLEFDFNSNSRYYGKLYIEMANSHATSPLTNWSASWANLITLDNPIYDSYYGSGTWVHIKLNLSYTLTSLLGISAKTCGTSDSKYNYVRFHFNTWNNGNYPSTYGPFIDNVIFKTDAYNQAPAQPSNPSPADNASNQSLSPTLSWSSSDPENDPLSYDVYFGQQNPPTTKVAPLQSGTSYNATGLTANSNYYWQVYTKDNHNNSTAGPVWKFTTGAGGTPPQAPTLSSPSTNATNVGILPTLNWNASSGATSYNLQVSTNSSFSSYVYNQSGLTNTSLQISGLNNSAIYYWRVNATNVYGTSGWSSVWNFTTASGSSGGSSCVGVPTVTYAGKTYNTVQIGTQCWLKENLDVGTLINGDKQQTNNGVVEKYCYDNNPDNCKIYGGLYQWAEAVQYKNGATNLTPPNPEFSENVQGICPSGWHIPAQEIVTLQKDVGNNGNALKSIGQGTGNGVGTNTSGFSALLAGYGNRGGGGFGELGVQAYFWSTIGYPGGTTSLRLWSDANWFDFWGTSSGYGYSIRCVKD